jgi:hypothetical protein
MVRSSECDGREGEDTDTRGALTRTEKASHKITQISRNING